MKDFFTTLCVQFANRSNGKKKVRFFRWLIPQLHAMGYEISVQSGKDNFSKLCNLVVGDIKHAKVLVLVPYDTPMKTWIPTKYYPLQPKKNRQEQMKAFVFQVIVSFLLACVSLYIVWQCFPIATMMDFCYLLIALGIFSFSFLMSKGIGNRNNYVRSHSALSIVFECMKIRDPEVAYALIDRTCVSYRGYQVFHDAYASTIKQKPVILLDSLGQSVSYVIASTKPCHNPLFQAHWLKCKEATQIESLFSNGYVISSGTVSEKDIIIHHSGTRNDCQIDLLALEQILSDVKKFIKQMQTQS